MKKTVLTLILTAVLLVMLAAGVSADRTLPLLVDDGDLLTEVEYDEVLMKLMELSEANQCEIAVVTVNSLDGKSAMAYADDYFDYNGYGWGPGDDGILLLVSMGEREYHITTHGMAHDRLDDAALMDIEDAFLDDLSAGWYADAFLAFAEECDWQLYMAESEGQFDVIGALFLSLVIGFVVSLIIVLSMKGKMTTVTAARDARSYVKANSLRLTRESDRFLYAQTQRVPRSDNNSSRGGTSSHRSSSGRSHGGHGGRF